MEEIKRKAKFQPPINRGWCSHTRNQVKYYPVVFGFQPPINRGWCPHHNPSFMKFIIGKKVSTPYKSGMVLSRNG